MQEYTVSGDVGEARVRLRELAAPFFHHDVVKQALLSAMQVPFLLLPLVTSIQAGRQRLIRQYVAFLAEAN